MEIGNCRLCGQRKTLVDSHVWPRFAYKRYVSDLKAGGTFVDLAKEKFTNQQYKAFWFCSVCDNETLGQWENQASRLCDQLDARPSDPHNYGEGLLPFLVSVSWRSAMKDIAERRITPSKNLKMAMAHWAEYLRGKRSAIDAFTQHLFVIFPADVPLHRGLGGQIFPHHGLVLSQIGPLFIVGLYNRGGLPVSDLPIWDQKKVHASGGAIRAVDQWHVGKNVTVEFARLLGHHEFRTKKKLIELFDNRNLGMKSNPRMAPVRHRPTT